MKSRAQGITIVTALLVIATGSWCFDVWQNRQSAKRSRAQIETEAMSRTPWLLESSSETRMRALVRIQDTPFWSAFFQARITSPSHVASQAGTVWLKRETPVKQVVALAPYSMGRLSNEGFTLISGSATLNEKPLELNGGSADKSAQMRPMPGTVFDLSSTEGGIVFDWPASLGSATAVEFSKDPTFQSVLFAQPSTSNMVTVDFTDRSPGAWYVRAIRSADVATASASQPQVLATTRFQLVESRVPDRLELKSKRWFTWRDRGYATQYRVEFANEETFKTIAQSHQTRTRELDLTEVPAGLYFARVSAIHGDSREFTSQVLSVRVLERAEILRAQAAAGNENQDLKLAAKGWRVHLNRNEMHRVRDGYAILRESELKGIQIDSTVMNTDSLIFELSREPAFANVERVRPNARGELLPPALPLGTLFARLRRLEKDGSLGEFGPASRLTTLLPAPAIDATKTVMVQDIEGFELNWSLPIDVAGYELRLSTAPEFTPESTKVIRTRANRRSIAAKDLTLFYWTVAALDRYGAIISQTSDVQKTERQVKKITITEKKAPAPKREVAAISDVPTPVFPAEDAIVVGGATATKYGALKWTFDGPPSKYMVEVATDGDFVHIVAQQKVTKKEFMLEGDLPEGSLFWRVRTLKARKPAAEDWSRASRFELVYE